MSAREPLKASNLAATCPVCGAAFLLEEFCPKDGAKLVQAQTDPMIGSIFAERFKILSKLGAGGMGSVYKGKHMLMDKVVAIKVLEKANAESARRFQQEAKLACQLQHPNIISVTDFGISTDGQPYLVMDFLEGQSLGEAIAKERKIRFKRAIRIFLQACDALNYAHKRRLIHRDLKPGNLMLVSDDSGNEVVKLVDFGIAKKTVDETDSMSLTMTGEVFGSPMYMSPEQCMGQKLDGRSDVYSLGCVMYETVTGAPPFTAASLLELLTKRTTEDPLPLRQTNPNLQEVPPEFEKVVFTAMHRDLTQRYQSMLELWTDLQAIEAKLTGSGSNMIFSPPQNTTSAAGQSGAGDSGGFHQPGALSDSKNTSDRPNLQQQGGGSFDQSGDRGRLYQSGAAGSGSFDRSGDRRPPYESAGSDWRVKSWPQDSGGTADLNSSRTLPITRQNRIDPATTTPAQAEGSTAPAGTSKPPAKALAKGPITAAIAIASIVLIGGGLFLLKGHTNVTPPPHPAPDAQSGGWLSLQKQGEVEFKKGFFKSSVATLEDAASSATKTLDEKDPQLIGLYKSLGRAYYEEDRYKDADRILRQADSICDKAEKLNNSLDKAEIEEILGANLSSSGKDDEAKHIFDSALAIAKTHDGGDAVVANTFVARAGMMIKEKDPDQALNDLDKALKLASKKVDNGSGKATSDEETLARVENEMGRAYEIKQLLDEAKGAYGLAQHYAEKSVGKNHPLYADSLFGLATINFLRNNFAEADKQYSQVKRIREESFGINNLRTAQVVACLGILKTTQGQYDYGIALLDEALRVRTELLGADNPEVKSFAQTCEKTKRRRKGS